MNQAKPVPHSNYFSDNEEHPLNLIINNLHIPIEKDGMDEYVHAASQKMKIGEGLSIAKILSKSLDLKNQNQFLTLSGYQLFEFQRKVIF